MKHLCLCALLIFSIAAVQSQVVIPTSTLPEIGEIQTYTTFNLFGDTISYRITGENQFWSYDSLDVTGSVDEEFGDIQGTALADSFPLANMVVSLTGFQSAAIRGDSSIEVIGLAINSFSAFGVDGKASFTEPFTFRTTPFAIGDSIHDSFSFSFQFSSDLIPGLDSITIPIPGATLDSLRLLFDFSKSEKAIGWGNLSLYNEIYEVLHVKQENIVNSKVELGVSLFGNIFWIDASPFLGNLSFGQSSTLYKFLSPDSRLTLLEFNEVRSFDGVLNTNGRINGEIISGLHSPSHVTTNFMVLPNPSNEVVVLTSEQSNHESVDVYIFSSTGQIANVTSHYRFGDQISIRNLLPGLYTLMVMSTKDIHSQNFLIIR